ncbi:hypothetical protein ACHAXA_006219 [Cyclostephanos tholiformis]|uniref:Trichohyalin n=1 Tax=Cyclostephanos tholiformis TaxID=382380 RepID=A0ABD3SEG6_9STRA
MNFFKSCLITSAKARTLQPSELDCTFRISKFIHSFASCSNVEVTEIGKIAASKNCEMANDENCPPRLMKTGAAVFGNIIFGSEYPDHSLCYSPSPLASRSNNVNLVRETVNGKILSFDKPVSPKKTTDEETSIKAVPLPKNPRSRGRPATAAGFPKLTQIGVRPTTAAGYRQKDSGTDTETNIEAFLRQRNPRSEGRPAMAAGFPKNTRSVDRPTTTANRQQDPGVSDSVNPAITGARKSKEIFLKETSMSVAELRQQRRREKEEVVAFNVKAEETRREVIELRKKLSERFRQAKVNREQRLREEHLTKIENEIKFKSQVHVEHKQTLKELEEARRRMSVDARSKLRKNHREGKERLKLLSIQEDQALFDERHASSVAVQTTRLENASNRRKSFAFRNGDARRIRELFAQKEMERMHEERESYELKWAGERDADEYRKLMDEKRRDSLALRNAEAKRVRDLETQAKADDLHNEHESYELKWAGERDADEYRKLMDEKRRDSLALRNAEAKRIRDLETQTKADGLHNEHESYELKWAGERDADEYRKLMDEKRRDSLALRNAEAKRVRDLETQAKADDLHNEHESYELKWAGERDADEYRKLMDEKRRDSLALRNAEAKRVRDLETQAKADGLHNEHESYELKWAGERDADEYRKLMDEKRRDSLALRNAEAKRVRDLETQAKADDLHNEHESYELKWAGERDADEYRKLMDEKRRDSLALRNAEAKRVRDLETQAKADDLHNEHESYELKWAGERDADEYRKLMDEKRRDSLALRNAEAKRVRDLETQAKADDLHNEHESYELKWAGERDADEYRKLMDEKRRDSLKFRTQEAAMHAAVMHELISLAQEREHESYMLKWAGENDAKKYIVDLAELRRQSLAFRNAESKRQRSIDEEMRVKNLNQIVQNEELNAACQRDVRQYQEECAARDRASLRLRGKINFASRLQAENDRQVELLAAHQSHLLDTAAWKDVNEYLAECKLRKRLSLAFRAKEKRRHFLIEKKQAEVRVQKQHRDTLYRSEDARNVEMANLKEKARLALESFKRHPNCTFGANPFVG